MSRALAVTSLVLLVVLASPAGSTSGRRCRRACRTAVHDCVTTTGQARAACRRQMVKRCKREGTDACALASRNGTCSLSAAPACGGACPPAFTCVPGPFDGCNCEAPACGPVAGGTCGGVCADSRQACLSTGDQCVCM